MSFSDQWAHALFTTWQRINLFQHDSHNGIKFFFEVAFECQIYKNFAISINEIHNSKIFCEVIKTRKIKCNFVKVLASLFRTNCTVLIHLWISLIKANCLLYLLRLINSIRGYKSNICNKISTETRLCLNQFFLIFHTRSMFYLV